MRKDNLLFGTVGLLLGLIIGFVITNNINRSAAENPARPTAAGPLVSNSQIPPDHQSVGAAPGQSQSNGAVPPVMAAIEKAKQQPQDYEAQIAAGDLYYQINRTEQAVQYYTAATKLKPGDTDAMTKLGNAYFDAEKYEEAEKWYLAVLEKDPKNINIRTDLGLTFFYRQPKDTDRAIKEYKASLSIDPKHEITLQNLAAAYDEKGDAENARATREKLKAVNPANPVLTKQLEN